MLKLIREEKEVNWCVTHVKRDFLFVGGWSKPKNERKARQQWLINNYNLSRVVFYQIRYYNWLLKHLINYLGHSKAHNWLLYP